MTSRPDAGDRKVELRPQNILSKERRPPVLEDQCPRPDVDASWLSMKLILNQSQHTFNCRASLTDNADNLCGDLLKNIFRKTQRQHETRHWLGTSADLWEDFANCLEEVVVQVQDLYQLPRGVDPQEDTFTTLVITNAVETLKDFQRSNDLILVARNMLVNCPDAQRYAVETTCHHEILNIIQICIEFNSEGFAGEAGSAQEQAFGRIINAAKVLLVSCLQFLFNLLKAGSELRTRIWLELLCLDTEFGIDSSDDGADTTTIETFKPDSELRQQDFDHAAKRILGFFASPTSGSLLRELLTDLRNNSLLQLHVDKLYRLGIIDAIPQDPQAANARDKFQILEARGRIQSAKRALVSPLGANLQIQEEGGRGEGSQGTAADFLRFRKGYYPTEQDFTYQKGLPASPYNLSEIPIILAPSGEIEALPMFILICVFSSGDISTLQEKDTLEQAIRCLFLVRSTTGRMLLRELYIFIAAWDLPEDELFFKGMVNITNSLHQHNLLYDTYNALADPKDVVSPGQNVLVKLILHIFKSIADPLILYDRRSPTLKNLDVNLVRFLLTTFRNNILPRALAIIWLQGQFRDGIASAEDFEKANLNLWDMERTYEGVYQYLELFSALNDNPTWKYHCIQLEIAWDIVELVRYLHKHIPIQPFIIPPAPIQQPLTRPPLSNNRTSQSQRTASAQTTSSTLDGLPSQPTERPYSPTPGNPSVPPPTTTQQNNGNYRLSTPVPPPPSPPSDPPTPTTTPQPPQTYPWRNLKKMAILVLSGLLYNTPSLRERIRAYNGITLIASCSTHDENNPYIKEHAVLCLKLLLEGDRDNQRLVEDMRAREVRGGSTSTSTRVPLESLESLGYRTGVDESGKVRVWRMREDGRGGREEVLMPVVEGGAEGGAEGGYDGHVSGSSGIGSGTGNVIRSPVGARFVEDFGDTTEDKDLETIVGDDDDGDNDEDDEDETGSAGVPIKLPLRGKN